MCFKCSHGGCTISPSNYIAHEGRLYCKHHHTQLIKEKGNLSQLEGDYEKNTVDENASAREVAAEIWYKEWITFFPLSIPSLCGVAVPDTDGVLCIIEVCGFIHLLFFSFAVRLWMLQWDAKTYFQLAPFLKTQMRLFFSPLIVFLLALNKCWEVPLFSLSYYASSLTPKEQFLFKLSGLKLKVTKMV